MLNKRLEKSQKAHLRLSGKWKKEGNSDKARAYGNYHADCYHIQRDNGKILSKAERRKLFRWWWDSEHK